MERRGLIVLDTHAWIWWRDAPDRLGRAAARALSSARRIGVPAIAPSRRRRPGASVLSLAALVLGLLLDPIGCTTSIPASQASATTTAGPPPATPTATTTSCGTTTPISGCPRVYVVNRGSGDVSVVDSCSHQVVATISVPGWPVGGPLSPNGSRLYLRSGNSVVVVDTSAASVVATVGPFGGGLYDLVCSADGSSLYASNGTANEIAVISTASNTVVQTIALGTVPWTLAVHPNGSRVHACAMSPNSVVVVDATSGTIAASIPVSSAPSRLGVSPNGSWLFVVGFSYDVLRFDTATHSPAGFATMPSVPVEIAFTPNGSLALVSNFAGPSTLGVIQVSSNAVLATVPVGNRPRAIAIEPSGSLAFVPSTEAPYFTVVDTLSQSVVATGPMPQPTPQLGRAAFSSNGGRVYLAAQRNDELLVLDSCTWAVIATVSVGQGPVDVYVVP